MKKIAVLAFTILMYSQLYSQITEKNWLVGGNARIAKQQEKLVGSDVSGFMLQVSPSIGYFLVDKFAAGINPSIEYRKLKTNTFIDKSTFLGIGPFVRYYFLPVDRQINLFSGITYQYLTDFDGFSKSIFLLSAGPVIYLNTVVGIEITANYEIMKAGSMQSAKTFFIGIGFQIHLEKEDTL